MAPLDREALDAAVRDGVVTREQADTLWARAGAPSAAFAPAAQAKGDRRAVALVLLAGAIGAALLLEGWRRLGGGAALALSLTEGAALALAARGLLRRGLPAAAGVAAALAAAAVPLAVRAWLQAAGAPEGAEFPVDLDHLVASPAFAPAVAWIVAVVIALALTGAPVLAAALVAAVWIAALVAAPVAFGPGTTWTQRGLVSAGVGYVALFVGAVLDRRTRRDHSAWLYLAGLVVFWGGLISIRGGNTSIAVGILGNLVLVLAALALRRRIFAVFGAIGAAADIGHLVHATLDPRANAPVLVALGVALFLGVRAWHRHAAAWERALLASLPEWGRRLLPPWPRG
jgi:hypothetical protein